MLQLFLVVFIVIGGHTVYTQNDLPKYTYCAPQKVYDYCVQLMETPSKYAQITCVRGRDRMDCLEMVQNRKADFVAADPEDMYVAYHMKNEDFSVFSEIRTLEESQAEFRYEGIILIKKNSGINSLTDLVGKKSCHTGYGRNVGYKIPITKLKRFGLFKVVKDPQMSPVEKELKGLSELFSSSCLVGKYSPNEEINNILKKKYSNLCDLCEDPVKCDYPDKYSGYAGAIKCLAENGGDVAFTKVNFVRRHFGLPVGNNPNVSEPLNDPNDFEYLCEDGTKRPVNGPACSWAQRPWQGYMSNGDVRVRVARLQDRIDQFYSEGKNSPNKEAAKKMWINEQNTVVKKTEQVLPGEHLIKAQYKDVIEREGTMEQKIRFCVSSSVELKKCETLKSAAYSRDIRPEFQCVISSNCVKAVEDNNADVVVLSGTEYEFGRTHNLNALLYESYGKDSSQVAVVDKTMTNDLVKKEGVSYDQNSLRSLDAALYFNYKRNIKLCPDTIGKNHGSVNIVNSENLSELSSTDKELICPDMSRKSFTEYHTCNFDATIPRAIFTRNALAGQEMDNIVHAFTLLSDKFGHNGNIEDVFEIFAQFEPDQKNVIFSDDASNFIGKSNYAQTIDENLYKQLHCL